MPATKNADETVEDQAVEEPTTVDEPVADPDPEPAPEAVAEEPITTERGIQVGEVIAAPGTSWVSYPDIEYELDEETGAVVAIHPRA